MSWNPFTWGASAPSQPPADLKTVAEDARRTVDALEAAATAAVVARQTAELAKLFREAATACRDEVTYVRESDIHPQVASQLKSLGYTIQASKRTAATTETEVILEEECTLIKLPSAAALLAPVQTAAE